MPEYSYAMVVIACNHAVQIAEDDSHGYNQKARYGPDYDCSSLVATCLQYAGFDINPHGTATRNLAGKLSGLGFTNVKSQIQRDGTGLQYGDILLTEVNHHTGFALGIQDGVQKIVDAVHDEHGGQGGSNTQAGDQTGHEIAVRKYTSSTFYRNFSQMEYVFRWTDGGGGGYDPDIPSGMTFVIKLPVLRRGQKFAVIGGLQAILQNQYNISVGCSGIDNEFGPATEKAVKTFQKKNGLKVDGIVGKQTTTKLLKLDEIDPELFTG